MKLITILIFSLVFFSCNSKQKDKKANAGINEYDIEKIFFYSIAMNVSDPNVLPSEQIFIVLKDTKIYLINEKYKDEKLISIDTLKTISNSDRNNRIIAKILRKYLETDQTFGAINVGDEGALGIKFCLKNGKQTFWQISHIKETLPKEVQPVYEIYENADQELYRKK